MKHIKRAVLASSLLGLVPTHAGTSESETVAATSPSTATGLLLGKFTGETAWDRAWSAFTLYKDESNPILQEFSLQGRLQVQTIYGDANDDGFNTSDYKDSGKDENVWGNDIEARRARFGFKSKWFQNWKFEGQIDVDTDGIDGRPGEAGHTLYKDLYDLYITYAQSDALNISVGKTKVKLGREQEISSKEIITIERSSLSNLLHPGELTGIWANGKGISNYWLYELGVYGSDRVREFSEFDAGTVILGKIGYDYSTQAGLDSAVVSLHYLHNTDPAYKSDQLEDNFSFSSSPSFTDCIAITNDISQGRFGLTTDLLFGFGFDGEAEQGGKIKNIDQSNVFGISIIPSYYIADGLQLVGRIQFATSNDDDGALGIPLQGRYEQLALSSEGKSNAKSTGDTYFATYLGLNYYLYGHKLKLMNGIEYAHLGGGDYNGYTFYSGLRFSF